MWAVIKFDRKNLENLKKEFFNKLGKDVKFYLPRLKLIKFLNKKTYKREIFLLGDYLLCFHKDFSKNSILSSLRYSRGLKYFLNDFLNSQTDIEKFVNKCKINEDSNGFLKATFFNFKNKNKYEFISGPFTNLIFSVLKENNLSVDALIGKYRITVSKENNLFRPV
jgi:hypothetical protein